MMIDLPMALPVQTQGAFDFSGISGQVENFAPVIAVVRQTWNTQTLSDLKEGKLAVPDDVVNESLAKYSDESAGVHDIKVTSLGDGKLRLEAVTKKFGRVDFLCRIDQFTHNKDISFLKFTVLEKNLPDQGLMSWIISRVSLSMVEKMVGSIELGEKIHTKVVKDTVAIDFHEALHETAFGKTSLLGYRLSDALVIESAVPKDGYIEFQTSLNLPDAVKRALFNIVK